MRVDEGSILFAKEAEPRRLEGFARAHDNARGYFASVLVKPTRAFQLPLEQSAIESMLEIARSQLGNRFDDLQPAEVGRVAHGRPPVSAPDRYMQQLRVLAQQPYYCITVIGTDGCIQQTGDCVGMNPLFQLRPI